MTTQTLASILSTDSTAAPMNVVIIDDLASNALLIKAIVGKLEAVEPIVFTDPVTAVAWCRENQVDMLLVDYAMPEMTGVEVIQELRAMPGHEEVPAVVITAEEDKDILYQALEAGANDFLRKPVDRVELIARSRNMLRLRSRQVALAEVNQKLHTLATTDSLTKVANRRHFVEVAQTEIDRCRRYSHPLTMAVLDVDHFKKVNDLHGHSAGDEVLRVLASVAQENLRAIDTFGRLGGEEFGICIPETAIDQAAITAERVRAALAEIAVEMEGRTIGFTVSIGLTEYQSEQDDLTKILNRADAALYRAKSLGRNRIEAG